jgi:CDP-glucose 4,6-dehydratase
MGALMLRNANDYNGGWNFGPNDTDVLEVEEILNLCIKEWGKGKIVIDKSSHPHEATLLKLDISKAKTYLHWHPVYEINTTVKKTIDWYKYYYASENNMFEFTLKQIEDYEEAAKIQNLVWCK